VVGIGVVTALGYLRDW